MIKGTKGEILFLPVFRREENITDCERCGKGIGHSPGCPNSNVSAGEKKLRGTIFKRGYDMLIDSYCRRTHLVVDENALEFKGRIELFKCFILGARKAEKDIEDGVYPGGLSPCVKAMRKR